MLTDNNYMYTIYMNVILQASNNKPGKFLKLWIYNKEIYRTGNM